MVVSAVESVLSQDYHPIEIILVDDGSTDDTPQVLSRLQQRYPEIIVLLDQENAGPGGAREMGRKKARGEYIQYLDSDDRLLPGKFSAQVAALRKKPDCGIAYGMTRLVDEHGITVKAPYKRSGEKHDYLFPALLVDRWWNTHTPLYRKSVCDQVGAWPCNRMSEDWQYEARFGALKTRLVFCDQYVSETMSHAGDRLTAGRMTLQKLKDISDLLPVLSCSAQQAGVAIGTPEMQHFSRWAFSLARQLAIRGESARAHSCFQLARASDKNLGKTSDYRFFSILVSAIGWKFAANLTHACQLLTRRTSGRETMSQSWT